jgi:hypothetical protein
MLYAASSVTPERSSNCLVFPSMCARSAVASTHRATIREATGCRRSTRHLLQSRRESGSGSSAWASELRIPNAIVRRRCSRWLEKKRAACMRALRERFAVDWRTTRGRSARRYRPPRRQARHASRCRRAARGGSVPVASKKGGARSGQPIQFRSCRTCPILNEGPFSSVDPYGLPDSRLQ